MNYFDEKNKRETFYTIIFDDLVSGAFKVTIIIELQGKHGIKVKELLIKEGFSEESIEGK